MKTRDSFLGMALLCLTVAGCQCSSPPVKEHLKPEGMPCEADSECETGLCDALPGQSKLCIRKCTDGCLVNEVCEPLGTDRYACVPDAAKLCEACTVDSDCPYPGDKCVQLGGALVCARDCSFDGTCPDSFQCGQAIDADESLLQSQCTPKSGTCECTAASDGQTVPCQSTNSYGTCQGVKTCSGQSGYSACNARTPTAEVCNGVDDDCNGQTDENLGETTCGTGECQVTVSNCANGEPQTCTPHEPTAEVCDDKDNDCDQQIDEDFDKQTDLNNCGICGHVCSVPNATAVCAMGECGIGACNPGWWNANGDPSDGCEYMCSVTNGGVELCDGIDNDCDGLIDEDFSLPSDPTNCGACGLVCNTPHATEGCSAAVCVIAQCDPGWADCDQQYSTGCEQDVYTSVTNCGACGSICDPANATAACNMGVCGGTCDPGYADCNTQWSDGCEINATNDVNNCGACDNQCTFANAQPACVNGSCAIAQCDQDWWDLDGNPANGCEYSCVFQSATDLPDLSFVDANCDGIDGEVQNAIFVAPITSGGNDTNPGTRSQPKATLAAGFAAAVANNKRDVYVSYGTYVEQLAITAAGKGVYGGYDKTNWSRSNANGVTVTGVNEPLLIDNANNATVQLITFLGANASGTSATAYGAFIRNSAGVTLTGLTIHAGDGTDGSNGGTALQGNPGGNGANGQSGCENSGGSCNSCPQPQGGGGGFSTCGRTGGKGGNAGVGPNSGASGSSGIGGTPGGPGVPSGLCHVNGTLFCSSAGSLNCSGNPTLTAGLAYKGADGNAGATGSPGTNGTGVGTASSGGYSVATTTDGSNGGNGNGGGGGGGGGGGEVCCDSYGSAGGGGGAGGCGGQGGRRGESGGASIALFLWDSSVTAEGTSLIAGNGGDGGNGGVGGAGGLGGSGGGTYYGGSGNQDDGSPGGAGGWGGNGGKGGSGGAGGGGPSIGVMHGGTSLWTPGATVTVQVGTGGAGGSSVSGGGAAGVVQQLWP